METLLDMGQFLAASAGKTHDHEFEEQMMDLVVVQRAFWLDRMLQREPHKMKFYLQKAWVDLEEKGRDECQAIADLTSCEKILKSTKQVPMPLSVSAFPFYFLGNETAEDSFSYTPDGYQKFYEHLPYGASKKTRYAYIDNYIYIFNNLDINQLVIEDVWDDPRQISGFTCSGASCYDIQNDRFPVDGKIKQLIIDTIIKNNFRTAIEQDPETVLKADTSE